jgi:hypothetical protein
MPYNRVRYVILAAAGATIVAAGCRSHDSASAADATPDLTLAHHGSVSPDLAIAPDEITPERTGRTSPTVRRRMLVHETRGPDLAADPSAAAPAPAAPEIVAVAATSAAPAAAPKPGHIAVVGSVAGDVAARPDPATEPNMSGPYRGDAGGGETMGPIIRGGSVGDDDHCERRPGVGGGGRGGLNPVFFTPATTPVTRIP